ncbi:MAG: Ni/Fe hydrogenase subunit beta [Candidatus Brocadiaceae bacterium]|mgnify:FL=1|nr:Ni/Fe hydrogenase subunit beta [Candidatus Brocadiaceae bacterium]
MGLVELQQVELDAWVTALIARIRVSGPQARGKAFAFDRLSRVGDLRLDHDVAVTPPKQYFLPPREALLRYEGSRWESRLDETPFVLFGVHPYDVAAIAQLDRLFAEGRPDAHYLARRGAATIVACDVQRVSADCFAGCMGTAVCTDGFDALLTKVDDRYVLDVRTEKGRALAEGLPAQRPAGRQALLGRLHVWHENRRAMRRHELTVAPEDLPALLALHYEHPVWAERAARCFSCGSCNLVCPTCYCFDVRDAPDWDVRVGSRYRAWDGCMLADFATVAGGHNFRAEPAARFRHRYLRKGLYIPEKIGQVGCVGCGRCISACVARIANPVEVFNRLSEEHVCPAPAENSATSTSRR